MQKYEVISSWKWFWFLIQHYENAQPVILNLDETSVRFYYEPRKGLAVKQRTRKRFGITFRRRISKSVKSVKSVKRRAPDGYMF